MTIDNHDNVSPSGRGIYINFVGRGFGFLLRTAELNLPSRNITNCVANGSEIFALQAKRSPFLFLRFLGQSVCKGEHDVARD